MLYQFGVPLIAIGTMLGNRHHSTIIHYADLVENAYKFPHFPDNEKQLFAILEVKSAAQQLSKDNKELEIFLKPVKHTERKRRREEE